MLEEIWYNENGTAITVKIYDCEFLKNTEIRDPDGVVVRGNK